MSRTCIINGPSQPLFGEVNIPSAKNASMPILVASALLASLGHKAVTIHRLPKIFDIRVLLEILERVGLEADGISYGKVTLSKKKDWERDAADTWTIPENLSSLIRASIYTVAIPLFHHGKAYIGAIGGDRIAGRNLNPHLRVFAGYGIDLESCGSGWRLSGRPASNREFDISDNGITATSLAMMIAAALDGRTIIRNASQELENRDLMKVIKMFGADAYWDNRDLVIRGPMSLGDYSVDLPSDQVAWGTYVLAGLLTQGQITARVCGKAESLLARSQPLLDMIENLGCRISHSADQITVKGTPRNGIYLETGIYPKFPSDLVPQTMVLMSQLPGNSIIVENLYSDRFGHAEELKRMGVNLEINANRVKIVGTGKPLTAARIQGGGIRESCALMLAGLVAKGQTEILSAGSIGRGYEDFLGSLSNLGANIRWAGSSHQP